MLLANPAQLLSFCFRNSEKQGISSELVPAGPLLWVDLFPTAGSKQLRDRYRKQLIRELLFYFRFDQKLWVIGEVGFSVHFRTFFIRARTQVYKVYAEVYCLAPRF
jgi:hypothetical protein